MASPTQRHAMFHPVKGSNLRRVATRLYTCLVIQLLLDDEKACTSVRTWRRGCLVAAPNLSATRRAHGGTNTTPFMLIDTTTCYFVPTYKGGFPLATPLILFVATTTPTHDAPPDQRYTTIAAMGVRKCQLSSPTSQPPQCGTTPATQHKQWTPWCPTGLNGGILENSAKYLTIHRARINIKVGRCSSIWRRGCLVAAPNLIDTTLAFGMQSADSPIEPIPRSWYIDGLAIQSQIATRQLLVLLVGCLPAVMARRRPTYTSDMSTR